MGICDSCKKLEGMGTDLPPHEGLRLSVVHARGKGIVESHTCRVCGAVWTRYVIVGVCCGKPPLWSRG